MTALPEPESFVVQSSLVVDVLENLFQACSICCVCLFFLAVFVVYLLCFAGKK